MQSLVIACSFILGVLLLLLIWVLAAVFLGATRGDGSPEGTAPCPLHRLLPQSYPLCVPHQGRIWTGPQGPGSPRKPLPLGLLSGAGREDMAPTVAVTQAGPQPGGTELL